MCFKAIYQVWLDAIAKVLIEFGMDERLAQQQAEDAAIANAAKIGSCASVGEPTRAHCLTTDN